MVKILARKKNKIVKWLCYFMFSEHKIIYKKIQKFLSQENLGTRYKLPVKQGPSDQHTKKLHPTIRIPNNRKEINLHPTKRGTVVALPLSLPYLSPPLFLRTLQWPVYSKRRRYISYQRFFMYLLYHLSHSASPSPEEGTPASHSLAELLSALSLVAILSGC